MGMYTLVDSAKEEFGTQREDYDITSGKASASVTLRVPAADRHAVVEDVLYNRYLWPHATPALAGAVASRAGLVPAPVRGTVSGDAITYDEYLVSITYNTADANQGQQTDNAGNIFSEELQPLTEYMKLDHKDFKWSDGQAVKEGEAPSKRFKSFNLVRTIYNLIPPLPVAMLDWAGCCNGSPYTSPTLGLFFPPQTLLFGDPAISRGLTTGGFTGIQLTLTFSYKPQGWNYFWRPSKSGGAGWDYLVDVATGSPYYNHPPADFSAFLF